MGHARLFQNALGGISADTKPRKVMAIVTTNRRNYKREAGGRVSREMVEHSTTAYYRVIFTSQEEFEQKKQNQ